MTENKDISAETFRRWDVVKKQISDAKNRAEKKHGEGSADAIIISSVTGPPMFPEEAKHDALYTKVICSVLDEESEIPNPEDDDFEQQLDVVLDKVITKRKARNS